MSNDFDLMVLERLRKLERELDRIRTIERGAGGNYLTKEEADLYYLGLSAQAADSKLLQGYSPDNFLLSVPWEAWTPTVYGWSTVNRTIECRYKIIGDTVFFSIYVSGSSNSTQARVLMPSGMYAAAAQNLTWLGAGRGVNNGIFQKTPIRWNVFKGTNSIYFHLNFASDHGWSSTGTKTVWGSGFFEMLNLKGNVMKYHETNY